MEPLELTNEHLTVRLLELGATLYQVIPAGTSRSLCLSLDQPSSYRHNRDYIGVTAGPVANRIARSSFELGGRTHRLEPNEGANHLHSSNAGVHNRIWESAVDHNHPEGPTVRFELLHPDGDGGYPGNLRLTVTYVLTGTVLSHRWTASTDTATPVSLVNHAYWNLAGTGTIDDHTLEVDAGHLTEVDDELLPTGRLAPVADTGFDLRTPVRLGGAVSAVPGGGIDHNYCLDQVAAGPDEVPDAAAAIELTDPASGRRLSMSTTLPGVQVYTGHQLDGTEAVGGHAARSGLCLETQFFPDSPNQPDFPSCLVEPGSPVTHRTDYRFTL